MKVAVDKTFRPVVITLESKREVDTLLATLYAVMHGHVGTFVTECRHLHGAIVEALDIPPEF